MASSKRKTKADLEAENQELGAETKRQKTAISSVAKEFVCPISLELPVDPVTAADGRVYNRASIQGHIDNAKKDKKELKSPITNEKMNDTLVPAIQVTNMIRSLIESGAVDGDLAKQWKEVYDAKKKAENGDALYMWLLGVWSNTGTNGLLQDHKVAYSWYMKSAEHGDVRGMACQGYRLLSGQGVAQNTTEGAMFLATAAERGSDFAHFVIGIRYLIGFHGFPKNISKAKTWLQKVVDGSCSVKHLHADDMKAAKEHLKEIEEGSAD